MMGFTALEPGSVWNTMPCPIHERRTEVYMYFGLEEYSKAFHMMGPSDETRHIAVENEQAIILPMWSIHSGCGTKAYTFCRAMGGENQRFDDMDHIAIKDIKYGTDNMIQELFDLEGKLALVTGGTQGIGMAVGMVLGKAGAKVCVNDLDEAKLEKCKERICGGGHRNLHAGYQCNQRS